MKSRPDVAGRIGEFMRPTGQETSLDVSFPDERPRFHVTPRVAVAATAVVAVAVGLILAWSLFGVGERLSASSSALPAAAEVGGSEQSGLAAVPEQDGGELVVSIVGEVNEPGLVTLAPGARIADAVAAVGGLADGADPAALNQAQLLVDGQQVVVPPTGGAEAVAGGNSGVGAAGSAGSGMVSLNSASTAELVSLDGVGEATAAAIIEHREQIGGFTALEQLLDVSGIGPAKFESISPRVTL